jgi:hypothetical protein
MSIFESLRRWLNAPVLAEIASLRSDVAGFKSDAQTLVWRTAHVASKVYGGPPEEWVKSPTRAPKEFSLADRQVA